MINITNIQQTAHPEFLSTFCPNINKENEQKTQIWLWDLGRFIFKQKLISSKLVFGYQKPQNYTYFLKLQFTLAN